MVGHSHMLSCDRIWIYRDCVNKALLKKRIRDMGLMSEWDVFGTLAVNALGMPSDSIFFYKKNRNYNCKANNVLKRILKCGNFGYNNDKSYRAKYSLIISSIITLGRRISDFLKLTLVFPMDSPLYFSRYIRSKMTLLFYNGKSQKH